MKVLPVLLVAIVVALVIAPPAGAVTWSRAEVVESVRTVRPFPRAVTNARGEAVIAYYGTSRSNGAYGSALKIVRRGRDGRLRRPETLDDDLAGAYDVSLGADGRAYVLWVREQREDDLTRDVVFAEAAPGQPFGRPRVIESNFGSWPDEVRLATVGGHVLAAYNANRSVTIITRAPGGQFSPPVRVEHVTSTPSIAVNERGDAIVSWPGREVDGQDDSAAALVGVSVREGKLGPRRVLAHTGEYTGYLRTGLTPGGGLLAAWQSSYEEVYGIDREYAAIRAAAAPAEGPAAQPFLVSEAAERSNREGPQHPVLTVAPDGSGVVAWQRVLRPQEIRYPLSGTVYAAPVSAKGRAGRPQALSSPRRIGTAPRVATDGRGRTVVVWEEVPRDSLSRPVELMTAAAGRAARFARSRTLAARSERPEQASVTGHPRGFLLVYRRDRGERGSAIVLRSGR